MCTKTVYNAIVIVCCFSLIGCAVKRASLKTATTIEDAPPLYEAVLVAQKKILSALPTLGE